MWSSDYIVSTWGSSHNCRVGQFVPPEDDDEVTYHIKIVL